MIKNEDGHIVILVECFYPHLGGGSLSQWKFAQQAAERGYDVTVFTPRFENSPKQETVNGVEIRRPFPGPPDQDELNTPYALFRRILFNAFLLPYLLVYLRRLNPVALYSASHLLHPVGKILSLCYGVRYIQFIGFSPSVRNTTRRDLQLYLEQLNFRLFMGDVVFARNQIVVEQVKKYNPNSHVDRIDGVLDVEKIRRAAQEMDTESIRSELGISEEARLLCWIGRMVEIKDPEAALKTVQKLPKEYHLVMVGDGPLSDQIHAEVQSRGLEDRVFLTGRVDHQRALKIIGTADGTLLTSKTEAYPTVVFESLALGTPVFSTPVGVLPEISEDDLFIGKIDLIPSLIMQRSTWDNSTRKIQKEKLERYSMARFSETILTNISK